jgi:hypothetical protein
MSTTGRHMASCPAPTRLRLTTAVAAVLAVAGIVAAVLLAPSSPRAAKLAAPPAPPGPAAARANAAPSLSGGGAGSVERAAGALPGTVPLVLTAAEAHNCPAAATACVDLARHLTWLQAGGRLMFGPVQMEPGAPGAPAANQTPRGVFRVTWKAGPAFVSNIYHEAMPWATFFAPGGIAFHGGSLTRWSHGCVHLTTANAEYYNEHLPVGAEVVVF